MICAGSRSWLYRYLPITLPDELITYTVNIGTLDEDELEILSVSVTVVIGVPPPLPEPPPEPPDDDTVIALDTELNTSGVVVPWSVAIALYVNVPVFDVTNEMVFVPPGAFIITFDPV